jgi:hypothetical protein
MEITRTAPAPAFENLYSLLIGMADPKIRDAVQREMEHCTPFWKISGDLALIEESISDAVVRGVD